MVCKKQFETYLVQTKIPLSKKRIKEYTYPHNVKNIKLIFQRITICSYILIK